METSLDPRVRRLPKAGQPDGTYNIKPLDQFGTFEVFVQPKEGRPFQHEGVVHAPDLEMAFIMAKEAFTRRFTCFSLCVADTRHVFISPMTEGNQSVYDQLTIVPVTDGAQETYEVFQLAKRGKQHVHAGTISASDPQQAIANSSELSTGKVVLNVWVIRTSDIRFATEDEKKDLWTTLPEKKFRDAAEYKGGEKLKQLLERLKPTS